MKKAHTLTACALLLAALTGCGGTQENTTSQPSETTTSATPSAQPTSAETPLNLEETLLDRTTGETAAVVTITSTKEVQCAGETMRSLTFNISAPEGSLVAPNYNIAGWTAYNGETVVPASGATDAAISCTPEQFHSVLVNPGETAEGIEVVLDTEGADSVGIQLAGPVQELTIGL